MTNKPWKKLADLEELPEGRLLRRAIGRKEFLVVRRGGRVFACGNRCPHQGALLHEGLLAGGELVCPRHGARFGVEDGRLGSPPALDDLPSFEVEVDNGEVLIGPAREPLFPPPRPPVRSERVFGIVGAGAAGAACAESLRRAGYDGRLILIDAEEQAPYDRTVLSKAYLRGELPAELPPLRGPELYEQLDIERLAGRRVMDLEPAARAVRLDDGSRLRFDRLLLATGGEPRRPGIPGEEGPARFFLRGRADAAALRAAAEGARRAVVIGAGLIGLEVAASLRQRGLEVAVAAPEATPFPDSFGRRAGEWVRALHERQGVRFHLGRTAREIRGRGPVEVHLSGGERLEADLVVIGAGIRPAVGYLSHTGLARDGEVPVDGRLETAAAGIHAAGDLAAVADPWGGGRLRVEHWVSAERQGRHAALAMLGETAPYRELPFFWTDQYGFTLKMAGLPGAGARAVFRRIGEGGFLAGYYRGERLVAAAAAAETADGAAGRELMALAELLRRASPLPPERLADEGVDLVALAGEPGADSVG